MAIVIETAAKTNLKPADVQELTTELCRYSNNYDPFFLAQIKWQTT